VTAMVDTSSKEPLWAAVAAAARTSVTLVARSGSAPPNNRGRSAHTSTGASAGRLSMKELTEKTALPAPGGP
jgi:hypothetical protein